MTHVAESGPDLLPSSFLHLRNIESLGQQAHQGSKLRCGLGVSQDHAVGLP